MTVPQRARADYRSRGWGVARIAWLAGAVLAGESLRAQVPIDLKANASVLVRQSVPYAVLARVPFDQALRGLAGGSAMNDTLIALLRPPGSLTNRAAGSVRVILFATVVHGLPDESVRVVPDAAAPAGIVLRVGSDSIIPGSAAAPVWFDAMLAPGSTRTLAPCALGGDAAGRQAGNLAALIVAGRIQIGWLLMSSAGPIDVGVRDFLPVQSDLAEPIDGYPLFPSNVVLTGSHQLGPEHFRPAEECPPDRAR